MQRQLLSLLAFTGALLAHAQIVLTPFDTLCTSGFPFDLTPYAQPPGGTWSGNGTLANNQFMRSSAGTYTLTYTVIDGEDTLTASQPMRVINAPTVTPATVGSCPSGPTQFTGIPSGGMWIGAVDANGLMTATRNLNSIVRYWYTDVSGRQCNGSQTVNIQLFGDASPLPFGNFEELYCHGNGLAEFDVVTHPQSYVSWGGALDSIYFWPNGPQSGHAMTVFIDTDMPPGTYNLTYHLVGAGDCPIDRVWPFTIGGTTLDLGVDVVGDCMAPFELTGGLPEGGIYWVDGTPMTTFDPYTAGPGVHMIKYGSFADTCSTEAYDSLVVEICTAVTAITDKAGISVAPNPVSDRCTFTFAQATGTARLRIIDQLGRTVFDRRVASPYTAELDGLPSAVYNVLLDERPQALRLLKVDTR